MANSNDRAAILRGMRAAMKLHRDLGTRELKDPSVRVDVYGTIARLGALLMFKPLDPLLGAFVRQGSAAGVVITSRRPVGQQRFTASHELGHLVLKHEPHADGDEILRRTPLESPSRGVSTQEREADAFASYFLLPKFALAKLHKQQNWAQADYDNPHTIYQASLRFGASYPATAFAYQRDKVISRKQCERLLEHEPRALKEELVGDFKVSDWRSRDVWRLSEQDEGTLVEAGRDDLFLLKFTEHNHSGFLWTFDELEREGFVILQDEKRTKYPGRVGGPRRRLVLGEASNLRDGEYAIQESRPWDIEAKAQSLKLRYRRVPGREDGLFEEQIRQFVEAA